MSLPRFVEGGPGGAPIEIVSATEAEAEDAIADAIGGELPEAMPVLPLREMVTFPGTLTPLAVGQERSMRLIDAVLSGDRRLVMVAAKEGAGEEPGPDDLERVGVAGVVVRMLKVPDGTVRVLVQGTARVRLDRFVATAPYLIATIAEMADQVEEGPELQALAANVQRTFSEIIEQLPYLPEELQLAVTNVDDPSELSYVIAGALRIPNAEKQRILEQVDVVARLRTLAEILARELEVVELGSEIQNQVQEGIDKGQREFFLREQLRAIQEELGEGDEQQAEIAELRERVEGAELPERARAAVDRELKRLQRLPQAAAEYGVIRTYLDWILDLPWGERTDDNLNLRHARRTLDADHYDLEKIKDRILEYLAVRKLNPDSAGSILCFAGPPGVGKTSLGRSIARALGRNFERISVGGVRDEAEIRGHRRTYVGAMPGTIVRALRDAGSRNPVFMIDEIDKMGADFRGDPASAMLEVLDPAQNDSFRDHYLDLDFDLSEVIFIATANLLDTVPAPLRDRMEVIPLSGYTVEEKLQIARKYLVPRQITENGLKSSKVKFSDAGIRTIIEEYTREAGVRNLERQIGSVCRKLARQVAEGPKKRADKRVSVSGKLARELLGRRLHFSETRRRTRRSGVATGLAWTPAGGEVLFIEATAMPGSGRLTITGQLGDVMKESAQAALSLLRSDTERMIGPIAAELADEAGGGGKDGKDWFARHDIHVHVPAGAVPKDGPSAGIAMVVALGSLISGRPVRDDVAMTGEITLTGAVLPIGGLKEKSLAGRRAGIKRVIVPERNRGEAEEIPASELGKLEFVFVEEIAAALEIALT